MRMVMLPVKNGFIHDAVDWNLFVIDILVDNKKVVEIEPGIFQDDAGVCDVARSEIYPGLVEVHAYTGLSDYDVGCERHDYNELEDIIFPQFRAVDGIKPRDKALLKA